MNANINCTLKGEYKVNIYSGKKLVETTDWFSNDITNYGMTYPFNYSFAQCFMFLSIGDEIHNTLNNNPNTGLKSPIKTFKVYNEKSGIHYQSGEYIGWEGYEIGDKHDPSYQMRVTTCGSKITKNGINLYRGWAIPTGNLENQTVVAEPNGLLIKQLMVSPSSGSDQKGNKAFSLVDRNILIPSGYNAVITYQLSINFKDYENFQFFSGKNVEGTNGYFNTGNAETGKDGSEIDLLSGWSNLSGIYRLIFPAIQLVDDIGACISPKIGYDLEPSVVFNKQTHFYLSPDISKFMVNKSGEIPSSEYEAYNQNGLMGSYSDLFDEITIFSENQNPSQAFGEEANKWFYSGDSLQIKSNESQLISNIRLKEIPSIANYNSGALDFSYKTQNYIGAKNYPVAFATPGKFGFNYSYSDFGQKAVFSTFLRRMPIGPNLYETGFGPYQRLKYVTKKAIFPSLHSYGYNSRYGSLVLARSSSNDTIQNSEFYPYLDFLFFDSEGRASNMAHYRYIPSIYLQERGSGIGRARFSITGENGEKPDSINRFFSATGFMGNGVSISLNSSGININHPMLSSNALITDPNNLFKPAGDKISGYLLPGQVLNENVKGNVSYNNFGYGSIYGVVGNSGFYLNDYDICLLDKPDWTGFGEPNPTGYQSRLCWPSYRKRIGLNIDVGYYLNGSGVIEDPNNYFADGTKQIIDDIVVRGNHSHNNESFVFSAANTAFCFSGIGDSKKTLFKDIKQDFKFRITGDNKSFDINIIVKSGLVGTETGVFFSGFPSGFSLAERGSGADINFNSVIDPIKILSGDTKEYAIIGDCTTPSTSYSGLLYIIPTNFKKPIGSIYHLESGYRILPNYAIANTGKINTYLPVTGGSFPGLSTENSLEIYLTLNWKSE